MFGIAKPCRKHLTEALHREWVGHQCGLCLTLREHHGQAARLTTNTDAIVLSVLAGAQHPAGVKTVDAAPCPLRGMRRAIVVAPGDPAIVHAASVSLTMAATKVRDHALDGDGLPGRVPRLAGAVGRRWARQGDDLASLTDFDTDEVRVAIDVSNELEHDLTLGFDAHVRPTEDAAAAACRHTAVIARAPHNEDALDELGRMFGRITYLFDAWDDQAEDVAAGRFNALVAAHPDEAERRTAARALFDDAHARLTAAFERLVLYRPDLARALLVDQLRRAGHSRFHQGEGGHAPSCRTRAAGHDHGHDQGHDHGHDHDRGSGHVSRRRPRPVRALVDVGAATITALGVTFAVFRPENPGPPPFPPQPPQQPGMPPPMNYGGDQFGGDPNQKQHWWNNCCNSDDCCDCGDCACCCCDSCDCCDCCDCDC